MNKKPYILCADDIQMNQIVITEMLEKEFYVECINNDGHECFDSITKRRPDLILLGDSMPLREDYDRCKFLRAEKQYKAIPVISLSSKTLGGQADTDISHETEYDLYLSQPCDEELLISSIKHLLSQ